MSSGGPQNRDATTGWCVVGAVTPGLGLEHSVVQSVESAGRSDPLRGMRGGARTCCGSFQSVAFVVVSL